MDFTIVTGLSGAGRSSALKAMEDLGCFCADNVPPALIPQFALLFLNRKSPPNHIAVSVDMRMGDMFDSIYDAITKLKNMNLNLSILFLDANDETLVSRFKYTRRQHPVSGSGKIIEGILLERENLQRIKEMANNVVDTSTYSVRSLAKAIESIYASENNGGLLISVITFGYKRGIPIDADFVFDMRFLPNPYYVAELKNHSGLHDSVRNYVLSFSESKTFLKKLEDMINFVSPYFVNQSKKQLVIGIGCTGGMHRSVVMGIELYNSLVKSGHKVTIEHRDINLESNAIIIEGAVREQ